MLPHSGCREHLLELILISIIISLSGIIYMVVCINEGAQGRRRRLDVLLSRYIDPRSTVIKPITDANEHGISSQEEVPLVYSYECPDKNWVEVQEGFIGKGIDPRGANMLSHRSGHFLLLLKPYQTSKTEESSSSETLSWLFVA